jgi:guanylate kinase
MESLPLFQYEVINDDKDQAIAEIRSLLTKHNLNEKENVTHA